MGRASRWDYLCQIHPRYRKAGRSEKGRMLDEFCKVTGYNRKYPVRVLNGPPPEKRPRKRRPRKPSSRVEGGSADGGGETQSATGAARSFRTLALGGRSARPDSRAGESSALSQGQGRAAVHCGCQRDRRSRCELKSGRTQGRPESIAWLLRAGRGLVFSSHHSECALTDPGRLYASQRLDPLPRAPSPNGAGAQLRRVCGSCRGHDRSAG